MTQLRRVLLVLTVLLCLALFVAPALAKPLALKATWNTNGVTTLGWWGDDLGVTEIVGSDIVLSGAIVAEAEENCKGHGIFVDKTLGLKAKIVSVDWSVIQETNFNMKGTAEVTADGENIGTYACYMHFYDDGEGWSGASFYLYDLPGNEHLTCWYVSPLNVGGFRTTL